MPLILTTSNFRNYWDFQTLHPRDHSNLSQEERDRDAFPLTHLTDSTNFGTDEHEALVRKISETVQAQTHAQCSADWFLDRMFSLTSSQFATVLKKAAGKITPNHPLREAFAAMLSYSKLEYLLPDGNPPKELATNEGEVDAADENAAAAAEETTEDLDSVEDPQGYTEEIAQTWMRRLLLLGSPSHLGLICCAQKSTVDCCSPT
jgi:hypothetical protein